MKELFVWLFLAFSLSLTAQLKYENRIEIDLSKDIENSQIIEFGKNGFIVLSQLSNVEKGMAEWKIDFYDVDLKNVGTKSVFMPKKFGLMMKNIGKDEIHAFFMDNNSNYTLVSINVKAQEITEIRGALPRKTFVKEMIVSGNMAYFSAKKKNESFLFSLKLKSGERSFIPISIDKRIKGKKISLFGFQVISGSNEVLVFVSAKINKSKSDLYVIRINENGEKEIPFNLTQNITQNLIDISASKIGENQYIFTGTYSNEILKASEGIFFCQKSDQKLDYFNFYNFLDLKNFLNYLPEKRREKIEKKKSRKEKNGKEFIINFNLATHEIIKTEKGYLFLSEAYYPTYHTESYTTTIIVNGRPQTQTHYRQVFDGFQYTHAVIALFDFNGKLMWDQSFSMWPSYKPFYEKRFISIAEQNQDKLKLLFVSGGEIVYKTIGFDGTEIQVRKSSAIEPTHESDKVKRIFSNIDYWYDDYFICYGNQKIKNTTDKEVERKRKVFFVSKVKFE